MLGIKINSVTKYHEYLGAGFLFNDWYLVIVSFKVLAKF